MPGGRYSQDRKNHIRRSQSLCKVDHEEILEKSDESSWSKAASRHFQGLMTMFEKKPNCSTEGESLDSGLERSDDNLRSMQRSQTTETGLLWRRGVNHRGNVRWTLMFCAIRGGFLFAYGESEATIHKKNPNNFNHSPKLAVPLIGCITETSWCDAHDEKEFQIKLIEAYTNVETTFGSDEEEDMKRWEIVFLEASNLNLSSISASTELLKELEMQNMMLNKQKIEYFSKLQLETNALREEKEKTESLAESILYLEKEKMQLSSALSQIREELYSLRTDHENTCLEKKSLETDYQQMHDAFGQLNDAAKALETEYFELQAQLDETTNKLSSLETKNEELSSQKTNLENRVEYLESDLGEKVKENKALNTKLKSANSEIEFLMDEKSNFDHYSNQMMLSFKELEEEKMSLATKLQKEINIRMAMERKLTMSERTLSTLELALHTNASPKPHISPDTLTSPLYSAGRSYDLHSEVAPRFVRPNYKRNSRENLPDVKQLRNFFETVSLPSGTINICDPPLKPEPEGIFDRVKGRVRRSFRKSAALSTKIRQPVTVNTSSEVSI